MTAIPDPDPGSAPGWTDDQLDRLIRQLDVARLNDDFAPWHAFLSTGTPWTGSRGGRVWACRVRPVHPHAEARDLTGRFTGCGETIDADTPGQMRDLLTARAAS
jgi:hypothetical protein